MDEPSRCNKITEKFYTVAATADSKYTMIENTEKKFYGVQFHPEVTHTKNGVEIFKNFLFKICKFKKKWRITNEKKD